MRAVLIRVLLAAILAAGLTAAPSPWAPPAQAQDSAQAEIDYEAWLRLATRAEEIIEAGRASTDALEDLRADLADWRELFLDAQGANTDRIATLQEQIAALGPPPGEGETEADEIAARRAELNERLASLQAPQLRAEEAFTQAEGLIREIDAIIRERQADELLSLGPSPLNPTHWVPAIRAMRLSVSAISGEIETAWQSDVRRAAFRKDLPRTLLLLLIATILVARGRHTMEWLTGLIVDRTLGRGRNLAVFFVSLGQIIVPVLGISLLSAALQSTGLLGFRGTIVARALPVFGIAVFGARWLSLRIFPKREGVLQLVPMPAEDLRQARTATTGLGAVIGLAALVLLLADYEGYDEEIQAVVRYPFVLAGGLLLARLGQLLRRAGLTMTNEAGEISFRGRVQALVGRVTSILGLAGVAMGAIGYSNAGEQLIYPTALSLGLLGLLLITNALIQAIFALATRSSMEQARESLIPTLAIFAVVLVSLPLFALLWGVREAQLAELWTQASEGFSIGETRISPQNFLIFAVVFVIGYVFTRAVQGALRSSILPKTKLDAGGRNAVISGVGYIGLFLAAVIAITSAGIDMSGLAIVAGALSVGVGFGLQNIVQNFVSGIILLIERPIAEGDWIEVGPHMGIVHSISVRSTTIETFDKTRVIVPNGDFISGSVTNWTRGNQLGRAIVTVGVAYGSDTRKVSEILKEVAQNHPLVMVSPEPAVDFLGFGADSMDFRIRAILSDVNFGLSVKTEMYHQIAERFKEEGIEIPFAQRDVWLRNPEVLNPSLAPPPEPEPEAEAEPIPPETPRYEHFDPDELREDGDPTDDAIEDEPNR